MCPTTRSANDLDPGPLLIRLQQTFGAHTGRSYAFQKAVVRIGRMPDSDVVFDAHADLDASGRHAELRHEGSAWVLVDVGSRNGTFVNGQRIQRHSIAHGDEIEFGPGGPRLTVELSAPAAPSVAPPGGMPARPDAATMASSPTPEVGSRPDAPTMGATPASVPPPPMGKPTQVDEVVGDAETMMATPKPATSPGPTPPSGLPSAAEVPEPKLYGQKTVGEMMIKAVQEARASATPESTRPTRWKLAAVVLALLVVGVVVATVVVMSRGPAGAPDPAHITAANATALYRVVAQDGPNEQTLCSAFAVAPGMLATTARCAHQVEAKRAAGQTVQVGQSHQMHPIGRVYRHPNHVEGSTGANVGLIEVTDAATGVVSMAPAMTLDVVRHGTTLLAFGYAHGTANGALVEVDRVEPLPTGGRLFHHDGTVSEGSALFDASGLVVGVHVVDGDTLEGTGHAVGSDLIAALLAGMQ